MSRYRVEALQGQKLPLATHSGRYAGDLYIHRGLIGFIRNGVGYVSLVCPLGPSVQRRSAEQFLILSSGTATVLVADDVFIGTPTDKIEIPAHQPFAIIPHRDARLEFWLFSAARVDQSMWGRFNYAPDTHWHLRWRDALLQEARKRPHDELELETLGDWELIDRLHVFGRTD